MNILFNHPPLFYATALAGGVQAVISSKLIEGAHEFASSGRFTLFTNPLGQRGGQNVALFAAIGAVNTIFTARLAQKMIKDDGKYPALTLLTLSCLSAGCVYSLSFLAARIHLISNPITLLGVGALAYSSLRALGPVIQPDYKETIKQYYPGFPFSE